MTRARDLADSADKDIAGTLTLDDLTVDNNVGIGDADPLDKLEVKTTTLGGITISSPTHNYAALSFARNSTATARIFISEPDALHTSAIHLQTSDASGGPNLITAMTIDQNQNVGIGTSSPDSKLHVFNGEASITADADADDLIVENNGAAGITIGSSSSSTGSIRFADSSQSRSGMIYYSHITNEMRFYTDQTAQVYIDSSGNVGVGTSSPSATLTVSQGANNIFAVERTGVGSGSGQFGINIESNSQTTMSYDDGAPLVIGTASNPSTHVGFSERMRIDSAGRVTMPYQPAFSVKVNSSTNLAGDTTTVTTFGATLFNIGNHFNTSTGIFTAPVAGMYHFTASARYETQQFTQNSYIRWFLSKNDGNYNSAGSAQINGTNEAWSDYMAMHCSATVYLSANDTIRVKGGMNGGTAVLHVESYFTGIFLG